MSQDGKDLPSGGPMAVEADTVGQVGLEKASQTICRCVTQALG